MSDLSAARSIFLRAIELGSPDERSELVHAACGDDSELRGRVDALLKAYDDPDSFFDGPIAGDASQGDAPTIDLPKMSERSGTVVGRYKLLQEIGEGGFGVVYMAQQTEPVERKVALKIIKPGMDSRQVIARFEAERQALALMDHQNIARVLDAGTTEAGLPYFVMELVKGVPITKYCDDNKLTPRQRLDLFLPVCRAIQHAHQKGVIHRDIKPSNVLVALYDGCPVPKVIDFGIAKATQQRLTERTMFTELGQVIGTFEYMSPEQAEMNQLDIDTRSDIYSLGVLLYELLTGTTPITQNQFREAGLVEMLRTIRETEPPKPSTRLSETGDALATISAVRQTEPVRLAQLVRGDLDWIVMKALEKDRSRRYESANDLAADIERHLHQEPVLAAAPSASYRMRKFVSRNKPAVTTAALLALLLLGFGLVSTYQAQVAKRSETRARLAEQDAKQSLDREQQARTEAEEDRVRAELAEATATSNKEQALDQLARSEYEQARAVRLLGEPGARFQALDLLNRAEELRSRSSIQAMLEANSSEAVLPTQPELRSEAVAALLKADGHVTHQWDGMTHGVSPNGIFLGSLWIDPAAMSGGMRVVDVQSTQRIYDESGEAAKKVLGIALAVGPDGKRLAAFQTDGHTIKLIDTTNHKVERTLSMPEKATASGRDMTFSPDGRWLLVGSGILNAKLVLWDLDDGTQVEGKIIGEVKQMPVASTAFGPHGKLLAWASEAQEVILWSLLDGKEQKKLGLPLRLDGGIDFSSDGTTLVVHGFDRKQEGSAGKDNPSQIRQGSLLLWDIQDGKEIARYSTSLAKLPKLLDLSDDGRRVAIGQLTGSIDVLSLETGEHFPLNHGAMLQTIQWTADSKQLITAGPGKAKLWQLSDANVLKRRTLETRSGEATITRFALSPESKEVAVEFAGVSKVGLFELGSGRRLTELENPSSASPTTWLTFVPGGEQLLRFGLREILLWNLDGDRKPRRIELKEYNELFYSVGFLSDGAMLVGGQKAYVPEVINLLSGESVWSREKRMLGASVRVSRDGQLVVSHDETFETHPRSIAVRKLPSGELLSQFPSFSNAWSISTRIEISPENRWVLELGTAGPILPFSGHAMGSAGIVNALGADDQPWEAVLWDTQTGVEYWRVAGNSTANAVVFSPDGRYLAISQRDGKVLLWDVAAKQELFNWLAWPQVTSQPVLSHQIAFTANGDELVATDEGSPAIILLSLKMLKRELAEMGLGW
ncbi:protein kinase [Aeoliella sp. ICT_H6.2]|uniref:Protein kinase n=1 Tax=Aeoliella straminimaris TaxID=2954799 RepID=A0A9X2FFJ9_9BACT|nr:WD40 repeat domain-containing serine/threonine-protein kinase [Aeoliella straminimaris]MCO6043186.1 protein kinase [Aeoliella straminimaris]